MKTFKEIFNYISGDRFRFPKGKGYKVAEYLKKRGAIVGKDYDWINSEIIQIRNEFLDFDVLDVIKKEKGDQI